MILKRHPTWDNTILYISGITLTATGFSIALGVGGGLAAVGIGLIATAIVERLESKMTMIADEREVKS